MTPRDARDTRRPLRTAVPAKLTIADRSRRAFGPLLAGLLLDGLDLATFGPIGLWTGLALGGALGWWLGPALGFALRHRWLSALLGGVYCTLPFTAFLPVASVMAGVSRFFDDTPDAELEGGLLGGEPRAAIPVDYEARYENDDEEV